MFAALDRGQPVAQWEQDEPLLEPWMQPFLTAFFELSTCRQIGMSLGPIPWTATVEYADRLGWDGELAWLLAGAIHEMDRAFLSWHDKAQKATTPAKGDPDAVKKPAMRQRRA